jgi:hypothetical protein
VAEVRAQYEVQLDDFKLAVVRLNAQMRMLCSQQPLQDIFKTFEEHTQRCVQIMTLKCIPLVILLSFIISFVVTVF